MKPRINVFLLIGGIVFFLAIAVSGYLLFRGFAGLEESESRLTGRRSDLSKFSQMDPFPSPENVARERENAQKLAKLYDALLADLGKEQIKAAGLSPSTFMGVLSEKRNKLIAEAKTNETALTPELGFGFEKYLGADSTLPAPEHVPRLTQQLLIVEQLCNILFSEHVRELFVVKREEFESVVAPAVSPGPRLRRPAAPVVQQTAASAGVMGTNDLYTAFRFTLGFKAGEKAVVSILNRLASSGIFIVVRKVEITKDAPDVRDVSLPALAAADEAKPAVTNAVTARNIPRQDRIVSGLNREVAMKVVMELEAYRFREPAN